MLELEVRELVGHDVIDFALGHALEEEVGERDGVAGAREGVSDLAFARRDEIDLLEFDAQPFGHSEGAVAEIAPRERLRLHAGELEQSLRGDDTKKKSGDPPERGGAKAAGADDAETGQKHSERKKSREDGIERLESQLALGPVQAAKFLLHRMRDAIAKEPENCGRNPTESFVHDRMRGEGGEARARRKEAEKRLGMAVVEGDPPGDERAVENPMEGAHVAEPDDGFVRDVGGECFAAKPDEEGQRREQDKEERGGGPLESRGCIAVAEDDFRGKRIIGRAGVDEESAHVAVERGGHFRLVGGIAPDGRNRFEDVGVRKVKLKRGGRDVVETGEVLERHSGDASFAEKSLS